MGKTSELYIRMNEIENMIIEGVDTNDYPHFCDAFLASADYRGRECTEQELDYIQNNYPERINELAFESLI